MNFRLDINGLRALAISLVLIFHFNSNLLTAGYIGVDVFFVISGFLMTGIIFSAVEKECFSLTDYYKKRAVRILPPLLVLCFFVWLVGWLLLNPIDYKILGRHIEYSSIFLSNIAYQKEAGYFDSASIEKWLLHTWSLSVEWQFYIVFPILIVLFTKMLGLSFTKKSMIVATAIGFVVCISHSLYSPEKSYYSIGTRVWEMLLGGIAFLYPIKLASDKKSWLVSIGLALIVGSAIFIPTDLIWPSAYTLIPVFGAYFVLIANKQNSYIARSRIAQKIGLWSYSIYLWHWPVVALMAYLKFDTKDMPTMFSGILISCLLGYISYRFVEQSKLGLFKKLKFIIVSVAFIYGLGVLTYAKDGFPSRLDEKQQQLVESALEASKDWTYPSHNQVINGLKVRVIKNNDNAKNILFIGASHIEQTYPYVAKNSDYNVYYLTQSGCFVTPNMTNPKYDCSNIQDYQQLFDQVSFEKVITSFYCFDCFLNEESNTEIQLRINEYNSFIKNITNQSRDVYVILGEPKGDEFDPKMSVKYDLPKSITKQQALENYVLHNKALEYIDLTNVHVVDPIEYLCEENCDTMLDNEFIYKDDNHMRAKFAQQHLTYLDQIISNETLPMANHAIESSEIK